LRINSSPFDDGQPGKVYYYNSYTWPDTYGGLSTLGLTPTRPDPPTNVTAISSKNTQAAIVSWIAPVDDGGEPISKYTIYAITGSTISSSTIVNPLTFTFTGLNSGSVYNFKVVATNSKGNSEYSSVSNNITTTGEYSSVSNKVITPSSVSKTVANSTSKVNVNNHTSNIIWIISLGCVIISLIIFIVYMY